MIGIHLNDCVHSHKVFSQIDLEFCKYLQNSVPNLAAEL